MDDNKYNQALQQCGAFILCALRVFIDESGDLGFKFTKPYGNGGSSRFLVIAYVMVPENKITFPHKIVNEIYLFTNTTPTRELKGSQLIREAKHSVCHKTRNLLKDNPDIEIGTVIVNKENLHFRNSLPSEDTHLLYNYMMNIGISNLIKNLNKVKVIPDNKRIKIGSTNSCMDYLKTVLKFDHNSMVSIDYEPQESHLDDNLIFTDWIANITGGHYENNSPFYKGLLPHIKEHRLFF